MPMLTLLNTALALLCFASMTAILLFQRKGRRFKRSISTLAWLLYIALLLQLSYVLLSGCHNPFYLLAMLLINGKLAVHLIRHRGNVSQLIPSALCPKH